MSIDANVLGGGNLAYLSLGSNIDPASNLLQAVQLLAAVGRVVATSSVWQSAPVGFAEQADFLNAAVLLQTPLSAAELKRTTIADIERQLGRVRDPANPNGPRTIDVDISLFNRDVDESNRIPDPDILTRSFVAVPLAELAAAYVHPVAGRTLAQIADALPREGMARRADVSLH